MESIIITYIHYHFINFDNVESNNPTILHLPDLWHHVQSIDLIQPYELDLIEQLKMKMPNLTSIILNFPCDRIFQLRRNLYGNIYKVNNTDIKLYSITTVHCESDFIERIKLWLTYILPNVKHLVISYRPESTDMSYGTRKYLEKLSRSTYNERLMESIYFSNIQDIEMKFFMDDLDDLWKHVLHFIKEILAIFRNS